MLGKGSKSLMQKAGTYVFVLRVWDNHAHLHKDHQVKPALERNQRAVPLPPIVYISGNYRGITWHGAWCRLPPRVYKTARYLPNQWQTVIDWVINNIPEGNGIVRTGVNGGFFSGGIIIGHVGTGEGWSGNNMLIRRWNFGMDLTGTRRFVDRMVLLSGTRATYTLHSLEWDWRPDMERCRKKLE